MHVVTYEMPIDKPKQVGLLSNSRFYYDISILSQPPGNTYVNLEESASTEISIMAKYFTLWGSSSTSIAYGMLAKQI